MSWLQDIVLGLVQGLTEFLPVSSSGHLVVVPAVFDWRQPSLTFDLVLHLGTLLAVVVSFRHDLARLAEGLVGRGPDPQAMRHMIWLLFLGSIPAGIAGLTLESEFESLFDEPLWVCAFWVVTACVLLGVEHLIRSRRAQAALDQRRAIVVGIAQAASITPGISRSGSTIAAGIAQGLTRSEAARFSFLLSIPAIAGAVVSQVPDVTGGKFHITGPVIAGFAAAAVSGYVAIEGFLRFLRRNSLRAFAYYLLVAAPVSALIIELR